LHPKDAFRSDEGVSGGLTSSQFLGRQVIAGQSLDVVAQVHAGFHDARQPLGRCCSRSSQHQGGRDMETIMTTGHTEGGFNGSAQFSEIHAASASAAITLS